MNPTHAQALMQQQRQDIAAIFKRIQALFERKEVTAPPMQTLLGRIRPTEVSVLAGRPGIGKTTIALAVAQQVADLPDEKAIPGRVLYCTTQSSAHQLVEHLVHRATGGGEEKIYQCTMRDHDWPRTAKVAQQISDAKVLYVDGFDPRLVAAMAHQYGLRMVVLDDVQSHCTQAHPALSREEAHARAMVQLKDLATNYGCPVLATSQVTRECEKQPLAQPRMVDVMGGVAVESGADVLWGLHKVDLPSTAGLVCRRAVTTLKNRFRAGSNFVLELTTIGTVTPAADRDR